MARADRVRGDIRGLTCPPPSLLSLPPGTLFLCSCFVAIFSIVLLPFIQGGGRIIHKLRHSIPNNNCVYIECVCCAAYSNCHKIIDFKQRTNENWKSLNRLFILQRIKNVQVKLFFV
jgi:hypothetical protein